MVEVEIGLELRLAEMLAHVLVGREERQEFAFALPHLHGVALDDGIRLLARDALLRQRDHHPLGMHQPAEQIEILLHIGRIHHELVDDGREARQREVQRPGGIRPDHALDRGVRDVALVPEHDVLQRRRDVGAHDAGKPGHVLRQDRVALVRHGRGALLTLGEELFGFQHLCALRVTELGGEPLDR